jgi:(p)ppGpp synthase/HD superfamily hydrolase
MRAHKRAEYAHIGQYRKIFGEPFLIHPIETTRIVSQYDRSDYAQALSLLHDIVDIPEARLRLPLSEVRQEFDLELVFGISSLSKTLKPMSIDDVRLDYLQVTREEMDPRIQVVRSGDKISNLRSATVELSIVKSAFWRHFKGGRELYMQWPTDVLSAIKSSGVIDGHPIIDEYEEVFESFCRIVHDTKM